LAQVIARAILPYRTVLSARAWLGGMQRVALALGGLTVCAASSSFLVRKRQAPAMNCTCMYFNEAINHGARCGDGWELPEWLNIGHDVPIPDPVKVEYCDHFWMRLDYNKCFSKHLGKANDHQTWCYVHSECTEPNTEPVYDREDQHLRLLVRKKTCDGKDTYWDKSPKDTIGFTQGRYFDIALFSRLVYPIFERGDMPAQLPSTPYLVSDNVVDLHSPMVLHDGPEALRVRGPTCWVQHI